jgi:hypothetical protein
MQHRRRSTYTSTHRSCASPLGRAARLARERVSHGGLKHSRAQSRRAPPAGAQLRTNVAASQRRQQQCFEAELLVGSPPRGSEPIRTARPTASASGSADEAAVRMAVVRMALACVQAAHGLLIVAQIVQATRRREQHLEVLRRLEASELLADREDGPQFSSTPSGFRELRR